MSDIDILKEQSELFERLRNTGNHYSYFKMGRKFFYFSTGGWSYNEELISELSQTKIFKLLLVKWETGGHYTFKIIQEEWNQIEREINKRKKELEGSVKKNE